MPGPPTSEDLPAEARRHLAGVETELVYNPYQTATWRTVRASGEALFLKAAHAGFYPSLRGERDRCIWLAERGLLVPEVVDYGSDERVEWLVTVALDGIPATAPEYVDDPRRTVPLLAEGLRAFHAVDPSGCPFDYRVPRALEHAADRVASGAIDPSGFHEVHADFSPERALTRLRELAPAHEENVVVCHGDYCFPNVLLREGRVVGYLDLGEVGLAERWRDLAVATWSVTWNVGPGYEDLFLDAYGTDWDMPRRDFYRLLYDLES